MKGTAAHVIWRGCCTSVGACKPFRYTCLFCYPNDPVRLQCVRYLGVALLDKGGLVHLQQVGALGGIWAQGCKIRQQGSQAQGHHLAVEGLGAGLPPHEQARLLLELDEVLRAHSLSHFVNDSLRTRSVSAGVMVLRQQRVSRLMGLCQSCVSSLHRTVSTTACTRITPQQAG